MSFLSCIKSQQWLVLNPRTINMAKVMKKKLHHQTYNSRLVQPDTGSAMDLFHHFEVFGIAKKLKWSLSNRFAGMS
jgi:hypothetical protein